jgi:hypothetical protein
LPGHAQARHRARWAGRWSAASGGLRTGHRSKKRAAGRTAPEDNRKQDACLPAPRTWARRGRRGPRRNLPGARPSGRPPGILFVQARISHDDLGIGSSALLPGHGHVQNVHLFRQPSCTL